MCLNEQSCVFLIGFAQVFARFNGFVESGI